MSPRRALLALFSAIIAAPLLTCVALQREAPLLLNLGPGDEAFARGWRDSWERDGLLREGATTFRWSLDGSRLEFPLNVSGDDLRARLRLARFVDTPVDVVLKVNSREVDRWRQEPHGWTEREVSLGRARGPLQIQLRSEEPLGGEDLGVAFDWVEVVGLDRSLPRVELFWGLALLFLGVPLLVAGLHGRSWGLTAAASLTLIGPVVIALDKLGGLVALSRSGLPLVVVATLLKLASMAIGRLAGWHERGRLAAAPALLFASLAVLALQQPFYYYPDVTSHVQALRSIEDAPRLTLDPELQQERGLHTRNVAGRNVVFPYSAGFHLLAAPLSSTLGDAPALKVLAIVAGAASSLCVFALALQLGASVRTAVISQALFLTLPAVTWRLTLALYPTLLAQSLELLLLLFVTVKRGRLATARNGLALLLLLMLPQLAYTGSLATVTATVLAWTAFAFWTGQRREALVLASAWLVPFVGLLATQYRELVTLAPELFTVAADRGPTMAIGDLWKRIATFYNHAYIFLIPLGFAVARRAGTGAVGRLAGPVVAALLLLSLRFLAPPIGRDLKDVELLAGAAAVVSAVAIAWISTRGLAGRVTAWGLLAWCVGWGLWSASHVYLARFVAVAAS